MPKPLSVGIRAREKDPVLDDKRLGMVTVALPFAGRPTVQHVIMLISIPDRHSWWQTHFLFCRSRKTALLPIPVPLGDMLREGDKQ